MKARLVQTELGHVFPGITVRKVNASSFVIEPPAGFTAEQVLGWAETLADFEDYHFGLHAGCGRLAVHMSRRANA